VDFLFSLGCHAADEVVLWRFEGSRLTGRTTRPTRLVSTSSRRYLRRAGAAVSLGA
jgi:hypothetical protein